MVGARIGNAVHGLRAGRSTAGARNPGPPRRTARKSWDDKLRPELAPRVVDERGTGARLLLPTPLLVADEVATVPRGRVLTLSALRARLAHRFGADRTCPLMTGIFATIVAGAVAADLKRGRAPRWPIWRLVRDDGTLHPKWPLPALYRATVLRAEGARLTRRNAHWAALDTDLP